MCGCVQPIQYFRNISRLSAIGWHQVCGRFVVNITHKLCGAPAGAPAQRGADFSSQYLASVKHIF